MEKRKTVSRLNRIYNFLNTGSVRPTKYCKCSVTITKLASSSTVAIVRAKLSVRPKPKTKKSESSRTRIPLYFGRTVKPPLGCDRDPPQKIGTMKCPEKFLFIFTVMVTLNYDCNSGESNSYGFHHEREFAETER